MEQKVTAAAEHFAKLVEQQLARVERMKKDQEFTDFAALSQVVVGICGGDGIGPIITREACRVLEYLLADELRSGKVVFKMIDGLTIENRIAKGKSIPDDVMEQLKSCHVILKGPTTTPRAGGDMPNLESANVTMRRELDLFANVRPVKVPEEGIDWIFFRENTEGSYTLGSRGINVDDGLAVDFTVTTAGGTDRIARLAYDYAARNGKNRVSIVTKANIIKTTDGNFLRRCQAIGQEYPGISTDDWYIDIMTANLVNQDIRSGFQVFILPNLYGDIITDEAAQIQGGVGTAGSANIGQHYAMFEAVHGSAPRLMEQGLGDYADPSSILRAAALLLSHIGRQKQAEKLEKALDICGVTEKKILANGTAAGATCREFGDYVMETVAKL
ncbi:MAG: isocitrate/isopropylmalate family dehydrogenase [Oscillospiraceae bacterium]|nr:isocitrate/isopropylmalate family dehydrogenase [Oscillospiraceae bacterium]